MVMFLTGFVTGALLGMVLMGCMAANTIDELLERIGKMERKEKEKEDGE